MKKQSTATHTAKTNRNLARLHRVLDTGRIIIKVDNEFIYLGIWYDDETEQERLVLESEGIEGVDGKTFSKDAIEQGTIDGNSITMTAEDGQEYLLEFYWTKAARL
jgi:hypothetical protein